MYHALDHQMRAFDMGEGVTMIIGPSRTGLPLEIAVSIRSGSPRIIHAMRARLKFIR